MRDDRRVVAEFCKIVQRFPDLYNYNSDTCRRGSAESWWDKVAECVRNELQEECTLEELKMKWKGIRSSYNRYKNRVYKSKFDHRPVSKYYLHKTLKFLDPFIRPRGGGLSDTQIVFEECSDQSAMDDNEMPTEFASSTWPEVDVDVKPVIVHNEHKKRKRDDDDVDEDNEDLQFFKSILPDIKDFTSKEKRKLKMSILKAIDDIDNERKIPNESFNLHDSDALTKTEAEINTNKYQMKTMI